MSVNDLRIDDKNKGWANLYMNNLTVYDTLKVNKLVTDEIEPDAGVVSDIFQYTTQAGATVPVWFLDVQGNVTVQIPKFEHINLSPGPIILTPSVTVPDKYKPIAELDFPFFMNNNGVVDLGLYKFKGDDTIELYPVVNSNGTLGDFQDNAGVGPSFACSFSYISREVIQEVN